MVGKRETFEYTGVFSLEGICLESSVHRVLFQWLLGVVEFVKILGSMVMGCVT